MVTSNQGQRRTTLGFTGDLVLGRGVNERIRSGVPAGAVWGDLRPDLLAADAMIGNLEGPITAHRKRWRGIKAFYFRADPAPAIAALESGNFRCVALANNHMLDFGADGLADTRRHLDDARIAFAGAGADAREAAAPALFEAGGMRVGFLSITNTVRSFAARPDRPGTCYRKIRTGGGTIDELRAHVDGLRRDGADTVVLSIHWGPNYRWWPPARYRRFARTAIELGVDIVHGHSAHVLQAVEFHRGGLILYDTGDFLEDFLAGPGFRSDRSFLFLVDVPAAGGTKTLRMIPASLGRAEVNRARGREADAIRRDMIRRCRGYAVEFAEADGELVARPPADAMARSPHRPRAAHATPPAPAPIASARSTANSRNR